MQLKTRYVLIWDPDPRHIDDPETLQPFFLKADLYSHTEDINEAKTFSKTYVNKLIREKKHELGEDFDYKAITIEEAMIRIALLQ